MIMQKPLELKTLHKFKRFSPRVVSLWFDSKYLFAVSKHHKDALLYKIDAKRRRLRRPSIGFNPRSFLWVRKLPITRKLPLEGARDIHLVAGISLEMDWSRVLTLQWFNIRNKKKIKNFKIHKKCYMSENEEIEKTNRGYHYEDGDGEEEEDEDLGETLDLDVSDFWISTDLKLFVLVMEEVIQVVEASGSPLMHPIRLLGQCFFIDYIEFPGQFFTLLGCQLVAGKALVILISYQDAQDPRKTHKFILVFDLKTKKFIKRGKLTEVIPEEQVNALDSILVLSNPVIKLGRRPKKFSILKFADSTRELIKVGFN